MKEGGNYSGVIKVIEGWYALLLCYAAIQDKKYRKIPNICVVLGAVTGIIVQISMYGISGIFKWLLSAAMVFVLTIPCYALHHLGAGDSKLFVVTVGMLGMRQGMVCLAVTIGLAGIWAIYIVVLSLTRSLLQTGFSLGIRYFYYLRKLPMACDWKRQTIPLAIPLFFAYIIVLIQLRI